jgi:hypothetical protein
LLGKLICELIIYFNMPLCKFKFACGWGFSGDQAKNIRFQFPSESQDEPLLFHDGRSRE